MTRTSQCFCSYKKVSLKSKMKIGATEKVKYEDGSEILRNKIDELFLPPILGAAERVKELKKFTFRHDDILIMSYPKSGTHWVLNLTLLLLNKEATKKKNFEFPPSYFLERNGQEEYTNAPSPRIFTSHLPPKYLPEINKIKVIYITRNPKDVLVSYWHMLNHIPGNKASLKATFEWFWDKYFGYGDWFTHNETYRNLSENNKEKFCLLVFEDLKRNPHASVKILADYLEIEVTDDEIDVFLDMASVSKRRKFFEDQKDFIEAQFYRKGEVGDWKNHFTVAMNEEFDSRFDERNKGTELRCIFE